MTHDSHKYSVALLRSPFALALAVGLVVLIAAGGCKTTGEHSVREGRQPDLDAFGVSSQAERERLRTRYSELSARSIGTVVQFDRRSGSATVGLRQGTRLDPDTRFLVVTDLDEEIRGILAVSSQSTASSRFIRSFLLEGSASLSDPVRNATDAEHAQLFERHEERLSDD